MKPILIAAYIAFAMAGSAAAQEAFNPEAVGQLRTEARLPGQPQRAAFDAGFVLDAGAAIAADHDNLSLTHVPAGSDWLLEIPTVVTMEGAREVRVSCDVSSFDAGINFLNSQRRSILLGATEHTFATGGPFLGRIAIGVSAIAANPESSAMVRCSLSASGVRNGVAWRTYEYAAPNSGPPAQYVLEADDSRLWTGAPFNRQVVLSMGGIVFGQ